MLLAQFKKNHNIKSLGFYQSNSSTRKVASAILNSGEEATFVTTKDFDATAPAFVFKNTRADTETGEIADVHWVTNKEPKEAEFSL